MQRRPMCLTLKNRKEKNRIALFCLETRARFKGIWQKPLKLGALIQLVGVADLEFTTRVDGWSLASCRCWRLEIIRSPG